MIRTRSTAVLIKLVKLIKGGSGYYLFKGNDTWIPLGKIIDDADERVFRLEQNFSKPLLDQLISKKSLEYSYMPGCFVLKEPKCSILQADCGKAVRTTVSFVPLDDVSVWMAQELLALKTTLDSNERISTAFGINEMAAENLAEERRQLEEAQKVINRYFLARGGIL